MKPHKLRHTCASLLAALRVDPGAMGDQLGHADPGFTLRVYRQSMRRDDNSKAELRVLVGAENAGAGRVSGTGSGASGQEGSFSSPLPASEETAETSG